MMAISEKLCNFWQSTGVKSLKDMEWRDRLICTLIYKNICDSYRFEKRDRFLDINDILIVDNKGSIKGIIREDCGVFSIQKSIGPYADAIQYFYYNNCEIIDKFVKENN